MIRCFLDMDEVFVDLMTPLARIHGVEFNRATWPADYHLPTTLGKSNEEIWGHPHVMGSEFWASLPKTPWADDLFAVLRREFSDDVCFLSQVVLDPWCAAGKVRWLKQHFPGAPFLVGDRKVKVAAPGFVLVDDYPKNVAAWNAGGGIGVTFPAPWNELRGHPDPVGLVERVLRERRREQEMI